MPHGRIALLTCAFAVAMAAPAPAQTPSFTYVVLGQQGAVARAIVPAPKAAAEPGCPAIIVNGAAPQSMTLRAGRATDFEIVVCDFLLPASATTATIGGQALPLPPASLGSIAVFGDTGCRLKAAKDGDEDELDEADDAAKKPGVGKYQDCKTDWPFQPMSETIAKAKPDLVIHVGDYLYRESPCDNHAGCDNSPFGDKWPTWEADFFTPAAALLKAAPWIVARGNHEICKGRAGLGYARLLDPTPVTSTPACVELIDQYTVTVGGRAFIVLDSSNADDDCLKSPCEPKPYVAQFAAMKPAAGTWLVTHRPIWGFTNSKGKLGIRNMTLQAALAPWNGVPPKGIDLVLSGHIHLWEAIGFADWRSPQFVLGAGSTELAHKISEQLMGQAIGGTTVAAAATEHRFGYTMFEPSKNGGHWDATFYDTSGKAKVACKVKSGEVECN